MKIFLLSLIFGLMMMGVSMENVDDTNEKVEEWENIGKIRITEFCPICNGGYESASGEKLQYGDCGCNFLPIGTKVFIEGTVFTVKDTGGVDDVIDIFVDTPEECNCNLNEYKEVLIKHEE